MYCSYYKKAGFLKRIRDIKGYCELQKCDILSREIIGKIPYMYCEGVRGKSNLQCGVFIHFRNKEKIS